MEKNNDVKISLDNMLHNKGCPYFPITGSQEWQFYVINSDSPIHLQGPSAWRGVSQITLII